jgi:BON domain
VDRHDALNNSLGRHGYVANFLFASVSGQRYYYHQDRPQSPSPALRTHGCQRKPRQTPENLILSCPAVWDIGVFTDELLVAVKGGVKMIASALSPVEQAIRQSPIPALRKLDVEETDAEIVLSGTVGSFYLKQLAQEAILPLLGPRGLVNRVQVRRE